MIYYINKQPLEINLNNIDPKFDFKVEQRSSDSVNIIVTTKRKKLKDTKLGEVVSIAGRDYIVLEHNWDTTKVLSKYSVGKMRFGDTSDWEKSDINKYLNGTSFLKHLEDVVGAGNIKYLYPNVIADDGTTNGKSQSFLSCRVSILSADEYRRFRRYIPDCGFAFWTLTPYTYTENNYSEHIKVITATGCVNEISCDRTAQVRPILALDNDLLVGGPCENL